MIGADAGICHPQDHREDLGGVGTTAHSVVHQGRFSTWFKRRPRIRIVHRQARVAVFPTCLVEYQEPAIGQDLVKVYERNGIECSITTGVGCCGAPWLHCGRCGALHEGGDQERRGAGQAVRRGNDIVVPQPTCSYILKKDYADYVPGVDADLVAATRTTPPNT